jgi:hypothetical protein
MQVVIPQGDPLDLMPVGVMDTLQPGIEPTFEQKEIMAYNKSIQHLRHEIQTRDDDEYRHIYVDSPYQYVNSNLYSLTEVRPSMDSSTTDNELFKTFVESRIASEKRKLASASSPVTPSRVTVQPQEVDMELCTTTDTESTTTQRARPEDIGLKEISSAELKWSDTTMSLEDSVIHDYPELTPKARISTGATPFLGSVPKKTVKKAGKPKPRRSSEAILTTELLEGELAHKKKEPVAVVSSLTPVAGSSTEPMDTSSSKDDIEHILISELGFSPNPKFLVR